MKHYTLLLFCVFNITFSYTQTQNGLKYQNNYYYQIIKDNYLENPELIKHSALKDYTISSFVLNTESGDLHWGQQADKSKRYSLKSEGIFRNKNTVLFGSLIMAKEYQENVKWNLSFMDTNLSLLNFNTIENPTYYGVSKGSKWSNQFYNFKGGIQFKLIKNIDLALYSNYKLKEKFRSQFDPRAKTSFNKLTLNGGLTINLSKAHKILFAGKWGYFNTENNIKYSDSYQNTPMYYKSYQKWISGYGTLINKTNDITKRKNQHNSLKIGYLLKQKNSSFFTIINFDKSFTENYKNRSVEINSKNILSTYKLNKTSVNILFNKGFNKQQQIVFNFKGKYTKGSNFLNFQKGINFNSTQQKYALKISYLKHKSDNYSNFGGGLHYSSLSQKDYLSNTSQFSKSLISSIYYTHNSKYKNNSVRPFVSLDYKLPLSNMLKNNNLNYENKYDKLNFAGKTLKLFYDEVIYHDYFIASKSVTKVNFGIQLIKIVKKNNFGLNISQSYIFNFVNTPRMRTQVTFSIQY